MYESLFTTIIAGYFTIFAAIIAAVLSFFFLTLKEYSNRKNNRNRLMFDLVALNSSLKAMVDAAQAENKIENPYELGQVAIVLKRFDTQNKLPQLQELITKSLIYNVKKPELFADFQGLILQIVVIIENIDDLNKINDFPDQKELLICKLNSIIKKIENINGRVYSITFYNE